MLAAIRRWFRRAPRAAVVPPRPDDALPADAPTETPAVVSAASAPGATSRPQGDAASWLRRIVAERTAALDDTLTPRERAGDAGALLARLQREGAGVVRQLPAAAQQALAVCNDPMASLQQLVPLFLKDPTLTQGLLRQANAAYYGGGEPIVGLREAVQRVGVGGVRSVVLAATVQGLLCRPGGAFGVLAARSWEHMGRTAPIARMLARPMGADPDEAFALGLLHDVGKLIVFDAATTLRMERKRDLQLTDAFVSQVLRLLHEPLGGLAIAHWGLGDAAAFAVGLHHREPPPTWHDPLGETIHLAELADYAHMRGAPHDLEAVWQQGALHGDPALAAEVLERA